MPWLRETRVERMQVDPRSDDGSDLGWSWPSEATDEDHVSSGDRRTGGQHSSHAKPAPSMHKALMVSGVLGGVMVLAIALVAVIAMRNSPSKSPQSAGFTMATAGASGSASSSASASTSAKAKKSAKPTTSPKASKLAKKPASSAQSPASTLTVPAGWKLAFDPSFSGSALNTGTWATCYDWATTGGCTNNPSLEKEWYVPSQVQVGGGLLNLVAQRESTQGESSSGAPETYACRSGMVTSKPGFNFTYGLIQVTAKLPYGPGLWPALWLAATNDQWPPELDIMEHWYSEQDYKIYDHTVGTQYVGGPVPTPVNLSAGFHTYSLLWTQNRVTWYLDGVQKFTTTDHVPQQAMYFIANVADRNPDGDNSSTIASDACNGTMQISSVKVWQP